MGVTLATWKAEIGEGKTYSTYKIGREGIGKRKEGKTNKTIAVGASQLVKTWTINLAKIANSRKLVYIWYTSREPPLSQVDHCLRIYVDFLAVCWWMLELTASREVEAFLSTHSLQFVLPPRAHVHNRSHSTSLGQLSHQWHTECAASGEKMLHIRLKWKNGEGVGGRGEGRGRGRGGEGGRGEKGGGGRGGVNEGGGEGRDKGGRSR